MRPETLDGDWNRLYREFPEVYDEFASVEHSPRAIDVIAKRIPLRDAVVVDVGSGTGRSTLELEAFAKRVIGVEPNPSMLAVAQERIRETGVANVDLLTGDAMNLPCQSGSADVVACMTTVFWPVETVVLAFAAEALRVLRPGGMLFSLNTAPGWYGGEFHDLVTGSPEYEQALGAALDGAGLASFDFETSQKFRSSRQALATYGFIFGGSSIDHLRETGQTTITWRWRVWYGTKRDPSSHTFGD